MGYENVLGITYQQFGTLRNAYLSPRRRTNGYPGMEARFAAFLEALSFAAGSDNPLFLYWRIREQEQSATLPRNNLQQSPLAQIAPDAFEQANLLHLSGLRAKLAERIYLRSPYYGKVNEIHCRLYPQEIGRPDGLCHDVPETWAWSCGCGDAWRDIEALRDQRRAEVSPPADRRKNFVITPGRLHKVCDCGRLWWLPRQRVQETRSLLSFAPLDGERVGGIHERKAEDR